MNRAASKRSAAFLILSIAVLALLAGLVWREQEAKSAAAISLDTYFSPQPGEYTEDLYLEMTTPHPGARIYFTLDGRLPDPAVDQVYTSPIHLTADPPQAVAVRALAALPGEALRQDQGPLNSATYFMNLDTSLPKLSIIVDPDALWSEEEGIYVNYGNRGREWERPVDVTYVTADGEPAFEVGAGLRIHGEMTRWFSDKKSLRLYFRRDYGPAKLEYPLFGPEGQTAFDKLILHNSGKDLLLFINPLKDRLVEY